MERQTNTDPTVIWRLRREAQTACAKIVPHKLQTTLLWWIDDGVQDAEDCVEWTGALERAEVVRARLLKDGWIDVTVMSRTLLEEAPLTASAWQP